MEAESHTATLSSGLVTLEGALATPEAIEPLMRAAHSLKGAARIVGLDAAVRVAHAMEDCFVAAQKGKLVLEPEHVDILLQGVDLLVQIAQIDEPEIEAWQSEHATADRRLVADIAAVQEGKHRTAEAPPSPAHIRRSGTPVFSSFPRPLKSADPDLMSMRRRESRARMQKPARSPSAASLDEREEQDREQPRQRRRFPIATETGLCE